MNEISIESYIKSYLDIPIIDVRSPAEFDKGKIIPAKNIPLFTNDERAKVGTVYKQQSKEKAIELGYKFVNPKLEYFVSESKKIAKNNKVVVYCWRGGMRSEAFGELLEKNGLCVYRIQNGYKAFRNYVLNFFEKSYNLQIIGGYTGSGKTKILQQLKNKGEQVIDLEHIAKHRGSAFGAYNNLPQPTTEQFENELFWNLKNLQLNKIIWLEDESLSIGRISIPKAFFQQMRDAYLFFLSVPKPLRAKNLVDEYVADGYEHLKIAIQNISKRLGGLKTKETMAMLDNKDYYSTALNCLDYYDKYYLKGLEKRAKNMVTLIDTNTIDENINAEKILKANNN